MGDNHIILAGYDPSGHTRTRSAYQYDYGQILRLEGFGEMLPQTFEMHFGIGNGKSVTMIGQDGDVVVPDQCLTKHGTITAWLYLHDTEADGETRYVIETAVKPRSEITKQEPTPVQQDVITQAIAALNNAVEETAGAVTDAENARDDAEAAAQEAENQAATAGRQALNAFNSAQSASQSASAAAGSASAASRSATSASAYASNANTSANSAEQSADDAAQSATDATQSAAEATQSANSAAQSAADAQHSAENIENVVEVSDTEPTHEINKLWILGQSGTPVQVPTYAEHQTKADKADTVLDTTLSRGRKANTNVGSGSVAFGTGVTASDSNSQAFGFSTTASGTNSHAIGYSTKASGHHSFASGYMTEAAGRESSAGGWRTIAKNKAQHVFGECNVPDPSESVATERGTYVEIVGNGTNSNNRSNARTLDWDGNEELAGDLKVNAGTANEVSVSGLSHRIDAVEIHETISTPSAVMTITDGADDIPIDELVVGIEPVQDLHGYGHPWPTGGGKNLLRPFREKGKTYSFMGMTITVNNDQSVTVSGTKNTTGFSPWSYGTVTLPAGTYKYNGQNNADPTAKKFTLQLIYSGESGQIVNLDTDTEYTLTLTEERTVEARICFREGCSITNQTMFPMLRLASIDDSTYEPSSNICPISGWTECNIEKASQANDIYTSAGTIDQSTDATVSIVNEHSITVKNTTSAGYKASKQLLASFGLVNGSKYRLGAKISAKSANSYPIMAIRNSSNAIIYRYDFVANNTDEGYIDFVYDSSNQNYLSFFSTYSSAAVGEVTYSDITIIPIDVYEIAFPSQAGTVYGGTLTINQDGTGTLVVDKGICKISDYTWTNTDAYGRFISGIVPNVPDTARTDYIISSCYEGKWHGETFDSNWDGVIYLASSRFVIHDSRYTTVEAFLNAVGNETIVYGLVTPVVYELTALEVIKTLKGTNNIWADTGAIQSLKYTADPKLYIDSKITAAVAAALNA